MDAKPQRPVRALHVAMTDENLILPSKQLEHQRHKSTGTMLATGVGAGNMANKRMALNEVSNVSKAIARDDIANSSKVTGSLLVKPPVVSDKLHRPAQRFHTQVDAKTISKDKENDISTINTTSSQAQSVSGPAPVVQPKTQVFSKRNNTPFIYTDTRGDTRPSSTIHTLNAPVVRINEVQSLAQCTEAEKARIIDQRGRIPVDVSTRQQGLFPGSSAEVSMKTHPDISDNANLKSFQEASVKLAHNDTILNKQDKTTVSHDSSTGVETSGHHVHSATSEPEEYWDEEEDGVCDEQGYTTLEPARYRNDNFTTGSTTILFPQIDNQTQQELAYAKEFVELNRTEEEIDDEAWDTTMVAEYGDEIFAYMRQLELKMTPNPHYMEDQSEIQWSMRAVLMDWLVQVHRRFGLLPETLFLCVNYIDRFLSNKIVSLGKLQLVGATAIFVAAKYEEINCPSVSEIVYMVDGGYTVDEILKAERFMLSMLQFELGWPGPMSFLRRISKADDYDLDTRTLAKYFLEVTIMDERFVAMPPSYTAAGSHCLARLMLSRGLWGTAHVHYSGYTYNQLKPLLDMMVDCLREPDKHHGAVFEKYSDRRFKGASHFAADQMRKGFGLPHQPPRLNMQVTNREYLQRQHMLGSNIG